MLSRLTWYDSGDAPMAEPELAVVHVLREHEAGGVCVVNLNGQPALSKVRWFRSLRKRWLAARGRSVLDNERRMVAVAREAGFRTPGVLAWGEQRRCGLVREHVLVTEYLSDHQDMLSRVQDAARRGNRDAVGVELEAMADFCRRMREAGLADIDFGAKHLLYPHGAAADGEPAWIDLEGACTAPPEALEPTARTVGAALSSWWVAVLGDESALRDALATLRRRLPAPRGGWSAAMPIINSVIQHKGPKFIRSGRATIMPPILT